MTTSKDSIVIHKEGEEGALTVNRYTGVITTPGSERPEWAQGLATAMLAERIEFYGKRLGTDSQAFKNLADPQAIAFNDLAWIGVDANGDEIEIEADGDHRMDVVAQLIGVDRETGEVSGTILAERDTMRENTPRTPEEQAALEESLKEGFGSVSNTERAQGTR
jgi:hypothetical protein